MQMLKARNIFYHTINKNSVRNISVNDSVIADNSKRIQNLKPWKEIPGPPSLPFIGPFSQFLPGGKLAGYKGVKLSERLYQLYGPIVRVQGSFGERDTILLFDPEAVENVLRSEDMMPIRPSLESLAYYRKRYNKTYDPKRVTGLSTDHGENWKQLRSKMNPIMMQPKNIKLLYTDVLEEVASAMVARLRSIRNEHDKITNKFNVEMNLWALESIGIVALGTRLNCFDPNLPVNSPTRKLIQNIHDISKTAEILDPNPRYWKLYPTSTFKAAMKLHEENENLINYFLDQAVDTLQESKNSSTQSSKEKTILEKLLEIDVRVARIMVSDMLMAGIDTNSNTVITTLYHLARNSGKQNKLRDEILAQRTRRSYLRACIKESMRIMSVVNGIVRLSTKEYNLLGYRVPNGVLIGFSHPVMSTMAEHYPKPDEFIPERWLVDKDDPLYHGNTHPFVMNPFGFGVRMCIGRRIAELEMETIISKIIENFQIDWSSNEPLQIAPTTLNFTAVPYNFIFKDL